MNRLEAAVSNDDDEIGFEALTDLSRRMAEWSDRFTSPCDLSRGLRTLSLNKCAARSHHTFSNTGSRIPGWFAAWQSE